MTRIKIRQGYFQSKLGITTQNAERLFELIQIAAVEGDVVQESSTPFGKEYKVDWEITNMESVELRTIWEIRPVGKQKQDLE